MFGLVKDRVQELGENVKKDSFEFFNYLTNNVNLPTIWYFVRNSRWLAFLGVLQVCGLFQVWIFRCYYAENLADTMSTEETTSAKTTNATNNMVLNTIVSDEHNRSYLSYVVPSTYIIHFIGNLFFLGLFYYCNSGPRTYVNARKADIKRLSEKPASDKSIPPIIDFPNLSIDADLTFVVLTFLAMGGVYCTFDNLIPDSYVNGTDFLWDYFLWSSKYWSEHQWSTETVREHYLRINRETNNSTTTTIGNPNPLIGNSTNSKSFETISGLGRSGLGRSDLVATSSIPTETPLLPVLNPTAKTLALHSFLTNSTESICVLVTLATNCMSLVILLERFSHSLIISSVTIGIQSGIVYLVRVYMYHTRDIRVYNMYDTKRQGEGYNNNRDLISQTLIDMVISLVRLCCLTIMPLIVICIGYIGTLLQEDIERKKEEREPQKPVTSTMTSTTTCSSIANPSKSSQANPQDDDISVKDSSNIRPSTTRAAQSSIFDRDDIPGTRFKYNGPKVGRDFNVINDANPTTHDANNTTTTHDTNNTTTGEDDGRTPDQQFPTLFQKSSATLFGRTGLALSIIYMGMIAGVIALLVIQSCTYVIAVLMIELKRWVKDASPHIPPVSVILSSPMEFFLSTQVAVLLATPVWFYYPMVGILMIFNGIVFGGFIMSCIYIARPLIINPQMSKYMGGMMSPEDYYRSVFIDKNPERHPMDYAMSGSVSSDKSDSKSGSAMSDYMNYIQTDRFKKRYYKTKNVGPGETPTTMSQEEMDLADRIYKENKSQIDELYGGDLGKLFSESKSEKITRLCYNKDAMKNSGKNENSNLKSDTSSSSGCGEAGGGGGDSSDYFNYLNGAGGEGTNSPQTYRVNYNQPGKFTNDLNDLKNSVVFSMRAKDAANTHRKATKKKSKELDIEYMDRVD